MDSKQRQKHAVADWWEANVCGSQFARDERFSKKYFDEIEEARYSLEPFIHSFAQFSRYRNRTVLEVGVGAGTDFAQWVRCGAHAHGLDLTEQGIEHVRQRLRCEGLDAADLRVGDAEQIHYADDLFDLVYSWGVIHHSPNPAKALAEIVRVTKPGGEIKVMVYNRRSVTALMTWVRCCLLRGKPFCSIEAAVASHVESPGTKAYSRAELVGLLHELPVESFEIETALTWCDEARMSRSRVIRFVHRVLSSIGGHRSGWFMLVRGRKRPGP